MDFLKETKKLYNGTELPRLGLGTWQVPDQIAAEVVLNAIRSGYRHIDTAAAYENEAGVGKGIAQSGIPRSELFVTSKIPAEYKTYELAKRTIDESLASLKTDYIDLMLIHAPRPWDEMYPAGKYAYEKENLAVWKALEEGYRAGKFRAIGVSNFEISDLTNILENASVTPAVNQVRAYAGAIPWETLRFCEERGIAVEAYSPLATGRLLSDAQLMRIAEKYGVSLPQLCIRYVLQLGMVALPKTTSEARMRQNAELGFVISDEDMQMLNAIRK